MFNVAPLLVEIKVIVPLTPLGLITWPIYIPDNPTLVFVVSLILTITSPLILSPKPVP